MTSDETPHAPANRPKFWRYYRERALTPKEVGRAFGRSREWVRLITLAFDDSKRLTPSPEDVARIHEWTGGAVGAADWYPPELSSSAEPLTAEATS